MENTTTDKTASEPLNDSISILTIDEDQLDNFSEAKKSGRAPGILSVYQYLNEKLQSLTRINLRDKVTFFQLLAIMIEAGVPLVRALYVLSQQLKKVSLRKVVATMAQKVENGKPLSDAMQDFSGIFNDAQIGMVRVGEASGRLNTILKQIAVQVEKTASLTAKVKGAMIYPCVIMVLMTGAVFVILGFVVPQLMELFSQANSALPMSTKVLIALSDFVVAHYKVIIGTFIVVAGLFYLWKRTPTGKYRWHQALLHFPIFGKLLREVALARFTRTLASLLESGIPIVKALQIDADAVGNEVYRKRLYLAAEDVSRGIPLAENLTDSQFLFPEMVVSMVAVGEQTAELDTVCHKVADYYDTEVDQMAANISKLMEPVIIVVMGTVVGGLIMAVMEPIFGLMDVVGNL